MSKHEYLLGNRQIDALSEQTADGYTVRIDNSVFEVRPISEGLFSVTVDGQKKTVAAAIQNDTTYVDIDSVLVELHEPSQDGFSGGASDHAEAPDKIFAPMPGKIVKLMVAVGDTVEPKQQVVIVEAMKMENPVPARAKGTVKAINCAVGDQVTTEKPIIELELEAK